MLEGYPLEIALTTANSAAQAWYGYDQASLVLRRSGANTGIGLIDCR